MTLVVNPHFRTGLVDDTYRYRIDWQDYATALLEAKNWDVLESGALRRRGGFERVPGVNAADWTAVSGWSSSYNIGLMPFTVEDNSQYLVLVEKSPTGSELTVRVYSVDSQAFVSVFNASVDPIQGSRKCTDLHYAQVGNSLFFVPADNTTVIEYVFRLYYSWSSFKFERVEANGELSGLWSAVAASSNIMPTFLGAYDASGSEIPGSALSSNVAIPSDDVAVNDQLWLEGAWRTISSVASAPTFAVSLSAFAHSEHLANMRVRYRYNPAINQDVNAIYATSLTFFEGRLCLGGIAHYRARGRYVGIESGPTRLRCSGSNNPFLLIPSKYNNYEDSPIDAVLSSPQLRAITWLAGGRVLYVGGEGGIVVIKSGLTPKTIQTVTVDSIGTCVSPPVVEQSGVIYIDYTRRLLVRLRYQDTTDGYVGIVLNASNSEKLNGFKRVIVSSGSPGAPRRLFALMNNGKLAVCGFDVDGNPYGWSVYQIGPDDGTFKIDDICDLNGTLYATVLSNGLGLGTRKLIVRLTSATSEFVGDFVQSATMVNSEWRVTNYELLNCTVGVTGILTGTNKFVNLGVFQTDANGSIKNENGIKLHVLFSLSAVKVYRIFESVARPTPAIPQANDGAGFGRQHRVTKVHVGVVNTRQIVVDGDIVQSPVSLANPHGVERPAVTGWLEVGKTGYDVDHPMTIEGSGVYAATVVGLSREVT